MLSLLAPTLNFPTPPETTFTWDGSGDPDFVYAVGLLPGRFRTESLRTRNRISR